MLDIYYGLFDWENVSLIRWFKYCEKLIHKQINFGDPTDQAIEQLIGSAIHNKPHLYLIINAGFGFVPLVFVRNPIVTRFHIRAITLWLQNWLRQEINTKRVIQVIQVIVRILLLP